MMRSALSLGRYTFLVIGLFFITGGVLNAVQAASAPVLEDVTLGREDAPITIIEYASMTCPHCRQFHLSVLPELKKNWIDTGKAKLIFRDFPLDLDALRASILARCAGRDRYYAFLDTLFRQQATWAGSKEPLKALTQIGQIGGVSEPEFKSCLDNKDIEKSVLDSRLNGSREFQINSTPSFIINGKKQSGSLSYPEFEKLLQR